MNAALKTGLLFQAFQFGIMTIVGLVWLFTHFQISGIVIMVFVLICLNLGSLILIISGVVNSKNEQRSYRERHCTCPEK